MIIRIPATTANMGPGFDTLGMALNLYNEFDIEKNEKGYDFYWEGNAFPIPLVDNLIYKTIKFVFKKYNFNDNGIGLKINLLKCDIPLSRGLGSSAVCIAAGIAAADFIMGKILKIDDYINIADEIEGHPDNVVPAIIGGMVISIKDNEKVIYSKVPIPEDLIFAVMIPDYQVSTENARSVLPESYPRKDCIFNISRISLLISALNNREYDKLKYCIDDKIHQPYRKKFITGMDDIFSKAEFFGALGSFLSGSGSTLISIVNKSNIGFETNITSYLKSKAGNWQVLMLTPDRDGIKEM